MKLDGEIGQRISSLEEQVKFCRGEPMWRETPDCLANDESPAERAKHSSQFRRKHERYHSLFGWRFRRLSEVETTVIGCAVTQLSRSALALTVGGKTLEVERGVEGHRAMFRIVDGRRVALFRFLDGDAPCSERSIPSVHPVAMCFLRAHRLTASRQEELVGLLVGQPSLFTDRSVGKQVARMHLTQEDLIAFD